VKIAGLALVLIALVHIAASIPTTADVVDEVSAWC